MLGFSLCSPGAGDRRIPVPGLLWLRPSYLSVCQPSPTLLPSYLWTSPPIGQLGSLLACDWLSHYWAQATISSVRHRPAFIPSRVIDPVCEDPCESVASAYKNRSQPPRQKAGRIHGILDTQILTIGTRSGPTRQLQSQAIVAV